MANFPISGLVGFLLQSDVNTTHHTTISRSPYEALYGVPLPFHVPYVLGDSSVVEGDSQLRDREAVIQELKHQLAKAQE